MKVLVACEFSGIVRDAFRERGHDAISCDLLPTEAPGPHYQGDVRDLDLSRFDLMIAHPPCTYLSWVGRVHWNRPGRVELRQEAVEFFMGLWNVPILRVCLENPRGEMYHAFRGPDQVIQPYHFGDREQKATCLWLRGLPPLMTTYTGPPPPPTAIGPSNGKKYYFEDAMRGSAKVKAHLRSKTFPGVAAAMAAQWG